MASHQQPRPPSGSEGRPRISTRQRHILTRIADGWFLTSDGIGTCWLQSSHSPVFTTEDVSMYTAERLVLRNLVHPCGYLLPAGWAAIGRQPPKPTP